MVIVTMPIEMWREENFRKEKMMTTMVMEITEISWSTRMTIKITPTSADDEEVEEEGEGQSLRMTATANVICHSYCERK